MSTYTNYHEFDFDIEEWPCFVSSLKYAELATPVTTKISRQMKLANILSEELRFPEETDFKLEFR